MEKWDNSLRSDVIGKLITLGKKSEDQESELVLESFYDHNLTVYLKNYNNQIIQGSRGTGKTHILRVLEMTLSKDLNSTIYSVFIDCRTIGSGIYNSVENTTNNSYPYNANTRYCQYFLEKLHQKLADFYAYQYFADDPTLHAEVITLLANLRESIHTKEEYVQSFTQSSGREKGHKEANEKSIRLSLLKSLDFLGGLNKESDEHTTQDTKQDIHVRYSADFPKFGVILEKLLTMTNKHLFLLLDEWSSIPINLQPYFAEFLRKTLFPISRVKFKIAVVPYRNKFRIVQGEQKLGLEMGHDVSVDLDLDRTYSVDKHPEEIVKFCYSFICRHLAAMLQQPIEASDFIGNMFDDAKTSFMLVRAAEGNPRDFIDLAFKCVKDLSGITSSVITSRKVIDASSEQLKTAKLYGCSPDARELLNDLIHYVVYRHKNRGFLIDRCFLDKSNILRELIDARVIHILDEDYKGYKAAMSKSCAILILNFGVYCDDLEAGKPINFFFGNDILERTIFPRQTSPLSHGELLQYDRNRGFYVCYVDLVTNEPPDDYAGDASFSQYFQFD